MKALTEAEREELILVMAGAFLNERDKDCVRRSLLHTVALDVKTRRGARAVEAFFAARADRDASSEASPGSIAEAMLPGLASRTPWTVSSIGKVSPSDSTRCKKNWTLRPR